MQYAPTRVHEKFGRFHISAHGYTKNAPDFRPKPLTRNIWGRMQYAPTRVREKPARFHISPPGYAKNPPDFTFPNRDTPKTRRVLDPNRRRGSFRGVCFCALHGHVQNLAGFRPKPSAQDISRRMLLRPTRVRAKFGGFHISAHGYTKNAPHFTLPNRDTPKTHPILDANLRCRTFRAYAIRPYTGTPKTCPVLHPNRRRGSFRGVCFCALHGYMKNLAGFGLCHATWRETRRVLDFATRHGAKPGGFWTSPHDMARNPAGFGLRHTTWHETRRVLDFATRHGAKPGGFWTLPHDIARNPAGFSHCHTFE